MQKIKGPSFHCPSCGISFRLAAFFPQAYYLKIKTECSGCNTAFDFWALAVDCLKQRSALFRNLAAGFIGAQEAFFEVTLGREEVCEFKFSDYGIPEDAKILYLNYTPYGGGMFPVELHSNQVIPRQTFRTIALYGRPIPRSEGEEGKGKVNVFVTFLTHSPDEHALSNLGLAFDAFLQEDYEAMIIPASVAIENTMGRLVDDFLKINGLPAKHRASKLIAREIILPLGCKLKDAPVQRTHILALIKDLWRYRDQMAHAGHLDQPIAPSEAAELLCAAMFEVNYFRFIYPRVVTKAKS